MTSLDARIANLFPSIILNLQESIRIPSIQGDPTLDAPFGIQVKEALNHALKTASSLGFKTYDLDGYVGWAEYGESENMIVVLGHLDVVPSGEGGRVLLLAERYMEIKCSDEEQWTTKDPL
ncbi:hypothetical protein [Acetomicrobium sp.]|uniref:hypothetical protein n=1 Tax=Acetomicrobium sp. TaxID=1872099 RepID=UPI0028717D80|nr:hypothetical protein [Acetomicrobium sp.]MDR9768845.1 hypothetical protein [Acetomicrobium sp.]